MSFTPGPWKFERVGPEEIQLFGAEDRFIGRITDGENLDALTPEDESNARLIAAAPDMYAALEALATWSWGQAGMDSDDLHQRGYAMARRDVKTEIAAALAKARGEAS